MMAGSAPIDDQPHEDDDAAAGAGSTSSLATLNSLANATNCPTSGNRGDLMVAVVTDITNNATYRVTGQQTGAAKTGNYSIIIEQLG